MIMALVTSGSSISDTTASNTDDFLRRFSQNGGSLNGSTIIGHDDKHSYHLQGTDRPICVETAICECPVSLTVSYLNVLLSPPIGIRRVNDDSIAAFLESSRDLSWRSNRILRGEIGERNTYMEQQPSLTCGRM